MLQVSTCVSVVCEWCGNCPGGQAQMHRGREAAASAVVVAALNAARAVMSAMTATGWRVWDGRVLCPECGALAECEATGHELTAGHHTRTEAPGILAERAEEIDPAHRRVGGPGGFVMGAGAVAVDEPAYLTDPDEAQIEIGALASWLSVVVELARDADEMTAGPLREEIRRVAAHVRDRESVHRAGEVRA